MVKVLTGMFGSFSRVFNFQFSWDIFIIVGDISKVGYPPNWSIFSEHQSDSSFSISEPNSNAFVDINGDCLSDLVVTSIKKICKNNSTNDCDELPQIEIWINEKGRKGVILGLITKIFKYILTIKIFILFNI